MPSSATFQRSATPGSIWPVASKRTRPCATESASARSLSGQSPRLASLSSGGAPMTLATTGPTSARRSQPASSASDALAPRHAMVRTAGLEPARQWQKILSLQRLPIPPRPRIAHDVKSTGAAASSDVEPLAHFLAGFEVGNALRVHVHHLPGARVAPGARIAGAGGKSAETAQLDPTILGQPSHDLVEEG